jgi:hypothetical protein
VKYFLFIICFPVFLFTHIAAAQHNYSFNLNIYNGLPSDHVYGIITDHHGYLWIATPKGVARYNGYDLKLFNLSEGLPYEDIWQLVEDKKGRIWLSNISSELGYIRNNKYHKAFLKDIQGSVYPQYIRPFGDGIIFSSLYIHGTSRCTICTEHNDTITPYRFPKGIFKLPDSIEYHPSNVYINEDGNPIMQDGNFLSKTSFINNQLKVEQVIAFNDSALAKHFSAGIARFIGNNLIVDDYYFIKSKKFAFLNMSTGMVETFDMTKWGATDNIEYVYYNKNRDVFYIITKTKVFTFSCKTDIHYLGSFPVHDLIADPEVDGSMIKTIETSPFWGNLIGTTNNGLFINYTTKNNFVPASVDLHNFTYAGGIKDNAQYWWNATTSTLLKIKKNGATPIKLSSVDRVDNVVPYSGDTVLVAGRFSYFLDGKSTKPVKNDISFGNLSFANIVDRHMDIYAINNFGFYNIKFHGDTFVSKSIDVERYRGLIYDSVRKLYWVYNDNRVLTYNRQKLTTATGRNQLSKFGVSKIEKIVVDNTYGNIFFQGQTNITIYNDKKKTARQLFRSFNLEEAKVYVYKNKLIVAGRFGIIFTSILGSDSLSLPLVYQNIKNLNYNYIYDCQLSWNKILLNTDKGAYQINIPTDSEITKTTWSDPFSNYKFLINYKDSIHDIKSGDTLALGQKDQRLQFDIINPNGNGQLKYTWRLPGDTIWHELNANELSLPVLAPDNYYKLIINAHDNVWRSDDQVIYVYIIPHWWQTHSGKRITWLTAIIVVLLLFTLSVLITRKLVLNATLKRNMQMELELKSIYSQINPHFIFNTLNSALLLVSKNRMEEAYVHISKFSRLLRSYIKSSRNKLVTIAEEIVNLKNYIELQQTRFKNRFDFDIILADNIDAYNMKIPSLLLQPFVENAINHGILNKQAQGNLKVEFRLSDDGNELLCIIEDDGIGRKNSKIINETNTDKDESYGNLMIKDLVNIFNKYEQMNIEIRYTDKEEPETGTIVTIAIKTSKENPLI